MKAKKVDESEIVDLRSLLDTVKEKPFRHQNRNGIEISSCYQMSSCITPHVYADPEPWEVDFSKHMVRNVPNPGLYNGNIIFYGGLLPAGSPLHDQVDEIIIFSPIFGYKLIACNELQRITNDKYFKYIKPLYDKKFVQCVNKSSKICIKLGYKIYEEFKSIKKEK